MHATENSMDKPRRGGIAMRKTMIADPTRKMVIVWPKPHIRPIDAELRMVPCRATMVDTATT